MNDSAKKYGGMQNIILHDGTELLLLYRNGVCGLEVSRPTADEKDSCRVIELTRDEVTANTKDLQSSRFAGVWIPMAIAIDSREKGFLAVW